MKVSRVLVQDCAESLPTALVLILLFSLFGRIGTNVNPVSAAPISPYIAVVPERTVDPALTVGMNYTISIRTDYAGTDIWAWQFSLTYDPYVLQLNYHNRTDTWIGDGSNRNFYTTRAPIITNSAMVYVDNVLQVINVNYTITHESGRINFKSTSIPKLGTEVKAVYTYGVINGDLISPTKGLIVWVSEEFNNTSGESGLTGAGFVTTTFTTSGPGILANITFTVVGTGYSDITLGSDTQLVGYNSTSGQNYRIVDAATTPGQIGHGYFSNIPDFHDVAITKLMAPALAISGNAVSINVTVRNEGGFTDSFNVTVYVNTTLVGTQAAILPMGTEGTLSFDWNTTSAAPGIYEINATALLAEDADLSDNSMARQIEIRSHNVAIISLETPAKAIIGEFVPVNVTVRNEGQLAENVTLTIRYEKIGGAIPVSGTIDETNFILSEHLASRIISTSWNTTGLESADYKINATATVEIDDVPGDNIRTKTVTLNPPTHDVVAVTVSADPLTVIVGEQVTINVTVRNDGAFNETLVQVDVSFDSTAIGSQTISLLVGESKILLFTWDTTDVAPNLYSVKAEAILDGDATPTDNFKFIAVNVEAPSPGHIAGTVKDASTGDPIVGANVTTDGHFDITDASGQFNITNITIGTYSVTASAAGYEASTQINIAVAAGLTTNLDFTLTLIPTTGHINGIVKDASTGNPIAGANVTADGHSVLTGVDGSYDIGLQLGTYTVTVSADGYEESSRTGIVVVAGESTPVNFSLTPIQPTNMLPYLALAAMVLVAVAGVAIYFLKIRK